MADEDDGKASTIRVASAGSLILLQLFSRFLTLFMTQMQIRLTSAEVLGAANIHFELLLGLILALSREGFRTALSRSKSTRSTRNIAILPVPIGACISIIVMFAYTTYLAPSQLVNHPHFVWATRSFVGGAILELLTEPLYIDALMEVDTMTRVLAEGAAVAAKSASTLLSLWYFQSTSSLLPFGIGQLSFGASFFLVFWIAHMKRRGVQDALYYLRPLKCNKIEAPSDQTMFNRESLQLSWTMTKQNIVKHALGEGDKFAVARLASLSDQGAYALASNYGSLVARLLYQPLEESSRLTFARALGNQEKPSKSSMVLATGLLKNLLSFHILLSLFLFTFCPPFSTSLLLILAGRRWALETSAPSILSVFGSTYVPAMAFNGLLEGFLQACAPPSQLSRYAFVLVAASGLFIASLSAFHYTSLVTSEKGLILASSLSTIARAAYCYHFTSSYLREKESKQIGKSTKKDKGLSMSTLFPHPITLVTFLFSAIVVRWRPYSMEAAKSGLSLMHIIAGLTCASMCASACILFERRTLLGTLRAIRGKREQKEE